VLQSFPAVDHASNSLIMRLFSVLLILVGLVLLMWGASTSESLTASVVEFFKEVPHQHGMWLIVGGLGATVAGAFGLFQRRGQFRA